MKKEEMIQTSDCSIECSLHLLCVCVYICVCTLACLMMNVHGENWVNHRINLIFTTAESSMKCFSLLEAVPCSQLTLAAFSAVQLF